MRDHMPQPKKRSRVASINDNTERVSLIGRIIWIAIPVGSAALWLLIIWLVWRSFH